jgi:hypothetical protein
MTASEMGRKGGKRRLKTMTPKERADAARHAINARWAKRKHPKRRK